MTVVVSISCSDGSVILGGDSFCGDSEVSDLCFEDKVYTVGPVGVGICGSVRNEQVLKKALCHYVLEKKEVTEEWIRGDLSEEIREYMKEAGCVGETNGYQEIKDSGFILSFNGKNFFLDDDFGMWESKRSFCAIGAGRHYAYGALSALVLSHYPDLSSRPEPSIAAEFVLKSLQIASVWSPWVSAPFSLVSVPPVMIPDEVEE